ncbi:hypothetical protein HYALB_00012193 [Hymenoscyphus albidus]|uniref:Uncharacterized protein n=1 Tax=Hymenoscyphus albidus TaxID=595503 RepID=A0A9N9LL06_9HELO|nr:hypothetical protein HYALB_00012193 [Hymenoscyphus albidus]
MADRRGKRRRSRLSDDDQAPPPRQNKRRREGYAIPPQPKSPPYPRDVSPDPKPKRKQDFRRRGIVAGLLDRIPNRKRTDRSATWPLLEDSWGLLPLPENIANPQRRTMVAWEPYDPYSDRVRKLKPKLDSEMVIQLMKHGIMEKKYEMTIRDMRKWLDSEREWTVGVGSRQNMWRGSRMLGRGGFGLVGLWERDPLEEGEEDANESVGLPKGLTKVAVKQQMRRYDDLREEGDLQKKLVETGTKHIVRIFPKNDESTVEGNIQQSTTRGEILRLLECLAGSTAMMEHGNENLKGTSWSTADPTESLVHFDIKPINQTYQQCMGKAMHFIMNKEKMLPNVDGTVAGKWLFFQPDITSPEMFRTTGHGILGMPYSVRLLSTVLRMLAIEPQYRIESRELLSICRESIRLCNQAVAATTTMEGKPLYDAQANLFTINRDQPRHTTMEEIEKVEKCAKNKLKMVENEPPRTVRTTATNSNDEESARIRGLAAMNLGSGSKEKVPRSGELIDVLFEAPEPDPMSSVIYNDVAKAESSIDYSEIPDFRDV